MLRILFGRYSRLVRTLEVVTLLCAGWIITQRVQTASWFAADTLLAVLWGHYVFIRFCHMFPWYPNAWHRDPEVPELGIEVHFIKSLVPTSYILAISSLVHLTHIPWLSWTILITANLMMVVVSGVNVILLSFHLRDKDPLPVNHFTHNLHLDEMERKERRRRQFHSFLKKKETMAA